MSKPKKKEEPKPVEKKILPPTGNPMLSRDLNRVKAPEGKPYIGPVREK